MKRLLPVVICFAALSCTTLTPVRHTVIRDPYLLGKCFPAYPLRAFRAVHVIDATIRGETSPFIGITIADVPENRIRATLLSVEGLVLLDAVSDKGTIDVYRSMQTFLSAVFAQGLFSDIRFMLFPERGHLIGATISADGSMTCRWTNGGHEYEKDSDAAGKMTIREYGPGHKHLRTLTMSPPIIDGLYKRMQLRSFVGIGYSLSLKLLEGEPLEHTDGLFSR